jgi:endoglucanase
LLESYPDNSGGQVQWQGVLDDPDYLQSLVEIVEHIGTKPGVYVMVSLWADPTFSDLGWPTADTIAVWERLAETFAGYPHVIYGLVNEPEENWNGALDEACWTAMNDTVAAIRAVETAIGAHNHVIAVQGTRAWARVLDYYITHPITAGGGVNIAYETHVYNPASDFDALFVTPSQTLPVIVGEFGVVSGMTAEDCGLLMDQAEALQIPYTAWTFHMRCPPNLIEDSSGGGCGVGMDLTPTSWGVQLRDQLDGGSP